MSAPSPGELYWAYVESGQPRPVIVVSREDLNRGAVVLAVPLTSSELEARWDLPNTVSFHAGDFGLPKKCVAQCEAIGPVEKSSLSLDSGPLGRLSTEVWRDVVRAIGNVICADCEPI